MFVRKARGLRIGRRLVRIWRWIPRTQSRRYRRLEQHKSPYPAAAVKLLQWLLFFKGMICAAKETVGSAQSGLKRQLREAEEKPPPKGYLVVYAGGDGKEVEPPQRYVVPIFYLKHPLFGELLREAEEKSGFYHPGGITIPCPASRFERVQARIAACSLVARRRSGCRNSGCS